MKFAEVYIGETNWPTGAGNIFFGNIFFLSFQFLLQVEIFKHTTPLDVVLVKLCPKIKGPL